MGWLVMIPAICLLFCTLGAAAFLVCVTTPKLRQVALSSALWFAVWGPCVVVWLLFGAMVGLVGEYAGQTTSAPELHVEDWQRGFGLGLFWLAVLSVALVASVVAWLHQRVIHRMTYALFRLYATLVVAGIGSIWGWCLLILLGVYEVPYRIAIWPLGMAVLCTGFGIGAWRSARSLRGRLPEQFAWVTEEEFEGVE